MSFLKDALLISTPMLADIPKFKDVANTAVYVVEHSEKGGVGVALNRNYSKPFDEIASSVEELQNVPKHNLLTEKVLAGGPVGPHMGWLLHNGSYESQFKNESLSIVLKPEEIIMPDPEVKAVAGLGTLGWGPGQLEREMAHFMWHYFPAEPDVLESLPLPKELEGAIAILMELKQP